MDYDIYELATTYFTHSSFSTPVVAVLPTPKEDDSGKSPLGFGTHIPSLDEANSEDRVKLQLNIALKEPGKVHYLVTAEGLWEKKPDAPELDLDTWESFVCDIALPQLLAVCKYEQVALTRSRKLMHARFSLETERRFVQDIRTLVRDANS